MFIASARDAMATWQDDETKHPCVMHEAVSAACRAYPALPRDIKTLSGTTMKTGALAPASAPASAPISSSGSLPAQLLCDIGLLNNIFRVRTWNAMHRDWPLPGGWRVHSWHQSSYSHMKALVARHESPSGDTALLLLGGLVPNEGIVSPRSRFVADLLFQGVVSQHATPWVDAIVQTAAALGRVITPDDVVARFPRATGGVFTAFVTAAVDMVRTARNGIRWGLANTKACIVHGYSYGGCTAMLVSAALECVRECTVRDHAHLLLVQGVPRLLTSEARFNLWNGCTARYRIINVVHAKASYAASNPGSRIRLKLDLVCIFPVASQPCAALEPTYVCTDGFDVCLGPAHTWLPRVSFRGLTRMGHAWMFAPHLWAARRREDFHKVMSFVTPSTAHATSTTSTTTTTTTTTTPHQPNGT